MTKVHDDKYDIVGYCADCGYSLWSDITEPNRFNPVYCEDCIDERDGEKDCHECHVCGEKVDTTDPLQQWLQVDDPYGDDGFFCKGSCFIEWFDNIKVRMRSQKKTLCQISERIDKLREMYASDSHHD